MRDHFGGRDMTKPRARRQRHAVRKAEQKTGSIEVGKNADLIILEQSPVGLTAQELEDLRVVVLQNTINH